MEAHRRLSEDFATIGLPDPAHLIGKTFAFGDDSHCVVGSITSIGYSPREGICFYVTTPRFRGMDIRRIERKGGAWIARGHGYDEVIAGKLMLF